MSKKYTKEELFEMPAIEVYKLVLEGKIIKKFPNGFWQQPEALENTKLCVKFMIEEILNWNNEDIKEKISAKIFKENKLSGMLEIVFKCSPYSAINSVYPNKFKEWEFKTTPQGFWILETGIEATKWLIEEKLKWTEEDIKEKLSQKMFIENRLGGMLMIIFNNSPYDAINAVYPNRFKPWELKKVSQNYWTLETGIETTKWLIEEKLKWTEEDIKEKLSVKIIKENNLDGMLQYVFNGSPYSAINSVYPNRFKPWEFKNVSRDYWILENGIEATKWLIEEKLKWTDTEIKEKLSYKIFAENNLGGMLRYVFKGSPYSAINSVYPGKFKKQDLTSYQNNFVKNK